MLGSGNWGFNLTTTAAMDGKEQARLREMSDSVLSTTSKETYPGGVGALGSATQESDLRWWQTWTSLEHKKGDGLVFNPKSVLLVSLPK